MKINKLKALLVVVCCLVAALWSEAQCMENEREQDTLRRLNESVARLKELSDKHAFACDCMRGVYLLAPPRPVHRTYFTTAALCNENCAAVCADELGAWEYVPWWYGSDECHPFLKR